MKRKVPTLRKACDKALQALGKERYSLCEVCGASMICMHHFFPTRVSASLRYDWDNLIPICVGCHLRHHRAQDPTIHATILKKRSWRWYGRLVVAKEKKTASNIKYYQDKLEELNDNK